MRDIIGIDPAREKNQAVIIDKDGLQLGKPFNFNNDFNDYNKTLWEKIKLQIPDCSPQNTIFAIECSINFWQNLSNYLSSKGYTVVLVSPLNTYHSRPIMNHDFSKTDPKDAILVASNAQQGYFDFYKTYSTYINAMHSLAITYHKLNKELSCNKNRLRSFIQHHFPEFLNVLEPDTLTARYLLKKYFLPFHFINLDLQSEAIAISKISHKQHGLNTLLALKKLALNSIGINKLNDEIISSSITLNCWITLIDSLEQQLQIVEKELIKLAKQSPFFEIICFFKGISETSTALFIAETRDLTLFNHYKQIEKFSGFNLRLSQSGHPTYPKRISHIGNKRLALILYIMTQEAIKYIPEVSPATIFKSCGIKIIEKMLLLVFLFF
jgi:transposase